MAVQKSVPSSQRNPNWTWDEQILAFDLYVRCGLLGDQAVEVKELSDLLRLLLIHPQETRTATFRNPNSVARKLSDIHTHQPGYVGKPTSGSKLDSEVWRRFGANLDDAKARASLVRESVMAASVPVEGEEEFEELHLEGRISYRLHRVRERDPKLRIRKMKSERRQRGYLCCEACDDRLEARYGVIGDQLYECHHLVPLHESGPTTTSVADVALLCPSCHRAAHRMNPWPSLDDLRASIWQTADNP